MKTLKEYYNEALNFKPQHPIDDETANFICDFIYDNKIEKMLEIGSGVGYSANYFAINSSIFQIDSYEKEFGFFLFAKDNSMSKKIKFIWEDFLYGELKYIRFNKYPLIFIDAAKSKQKEIFEKSLQFLSDKGTIIVDNINLNRVKEKSDDLNIDSRKAKNIKKMLTKAAEFKEYLNCIENFDVKFLNIGDGIVICKRK